MKANFLKRLGAFLIDYFIVTFLLSLITIGFKTDSGLTKEANDLVNSYAKEEISIDEYNEKVVDINYRLQKGNVWVNGISCALYIGYFVVFGYLNKGQTLGKKLFKIKVVKGENVRVDLKGMILRSLFIYGIISTFYASIFVNLLDANKFNIGGTIISYIEYFFIMISFFMALYRKDKRGLHDIIANTSVVSEVK